MEIVPGLSFVQRLVGNVDYLLQYFADILLAGFLIRGGGRTVIRIHRLHSVGLGYHSDLATGMHHSTLIVHNPKPKPKTDSPNTFGVVTKRRRLKLPHNFKPEFSHYTNANATRPPRYRFWASILGKKWRNFFEIFK